MAWMALLIPMMVSLLLPEDGGPAGADDAGADDPVFLGDGDDIFSGSLLADVVYGGAGADTLSGGAGDDSLFGGAQSDQLNGDEGDDLLVGGHGYDTIIGGGGDDTLISGALTGDADDLKQALEDDPLATDVTQFVDTTPAGRTELVGGTGDDILIGSSSGDALAGGYGDDTLLGMDGNDVLDDYSGDGFISGGSGNDSITASNGTKAIYGDAGNDSFFVIDGHTTIYGGDGDDSIISMTFRPGEYHEIWGGDGADHISVYSGSDIPTRIADFDPTQDQLCLEMGHITRNSEEFEDFLGTYEDGVSPRPYDVSVSQWSDGTQSGIRLDFDPPHQVLRPQSIILIGVTGADFDVASLRFVSGY